VTTLNRSLGLALAVGMLTTLTACDHDDPVVHQSSSAARHEYEKQVRNWTRWALEQPHSTASPIADTSGEFCDVDQSGQVWRLAGTFGGPVERSCTIPADRYLFFPLVNRWCIAPEGAYESPEAFQEFLHEYYPWNREHTCILTLRLDGVDLLGDDLADLDEALYVDVYDTFITDINADNWATQYGFEGGPTVTAADGHFALLRPLEPGEHVLEFGGTICDEGEVDFETSAVYHLTVEE
jgi:hypothetical protein